MGKTKIKLGKLNNYEKGILFSIVHGVGSYSFSNSFGYSVSMFSRKKELIRKFIIYKLIFVKHKEEIRKYFYNAIVKNAKQRNRFLTFWKIVPFPIRPSWYYAYQLNLTLYEDKMGNYWSPGVFTNVKVSLLRILNDLEDNYENYPEWYKAFVYILYFIALDGKPCKRGRLKEWHEKAEKRLKGLLDRKLLI